MTQILGNDKQSLVFEIVSARIHEENGIKKHVIYTLQVRHISGNDDLSPSVIERRYTDFLNLYNGLKKEKPQLMLNVTFPKKVLIGNYDNELISSRSTGFESLLKHVSNESNLRASYALISFLRDSELEKAKELLDKKEYTMALSYLENGFRLLNKVFTDRSPVVLLMLCRLLGCCMSIPGCPNAEKWADIALRRYEGVSDSDLLQLYVPLLLVCIKIYWQVGKDKNVLEDRLQKLKKLGMKVNENGNLLDEVEMVESKIFKV